MEALIRSYDTVDDKWSAEYFAEIGQLVTSFLDAEHAVWSGLLGELKAGRSGVGPFLEMASTRRGVLLSVLVPLKVQCEIRAARGGTPLPGRSPGPAPAPPAPTAAPERRETILKRIAALVDADDLEEEVAFADLAANEQEGLIELLVSGEAFPARSRLLDRLWNLAEILLIADHTLPSPSRSLFGALTQDSVEGARFRIVQRLLSATEMPTAEAVAREFGASGLPATPSDVHIVWRCLLAEHRDAAIRSFVAGALALYATDDKAAAGRRDSLWRSIAHPRVPIRALVALGARFEMKETDDHRKLFFDCTRSRLVSAVREEHEDWQTIGELITVFFKFPFFVQRDYFERLEELFALFREKAAPLGIAIDYFDEVMRQLGTMKVDVGNAEAKLPKGIERLPLAVQRHLAREERHYVDHFVLHPEDRIAVEARRHIDLGNIDRLLAYRAINGRLFSKLLQTKEFFTRTATVIIALNHPKCDQSFAAIHCKMMPPRQLEKIVYGAANPVVRAVAQRALQRE